MLPPRLCLPRSLDPGLLYLTRPPPCDLCGALLPLSILISINSRALSSASRCLLSSLTTPPLSLGQPPLFMILSNPWHRHLLVDRRYTLRITRAATSRHTPAPRRAEGERLMGFL